MAGDVSRNRALGPAPINERPGKELQFAAGRRKAAFDLTVNLHAHETTSFFIAIRTRNRNDVRRSRLRRAREHASEMIFAHVVEFITRHILFINCADLFVYFKRPITSHEFKRR